MKYLKIILILFLIFQITFIDNSVSSQQEDDDIQTSLVSKIAWSPDSRKITLSLYEAVEGSYSFSDLYI